MTVNAATAGEVAVGAGRFLPDPGYRVTCALLMSGSEQRTVRSGGERGSTISAETYLEGTAKPASLWSHQNIATFIEINRTEKANMTADHFV